MHEGPTRLGDRGAYTVGPVKTVTLNRKFTKAKMCDLKPRGLGFRV